ncbi:uncharacterized protein SPSK_05716 [Sporothrix schenckii 1099-18]|uniref:Uncharacterized protein n=1 Tax=Sporothrix schenckii 1099-18 TaxID=1397361 RepID=A0A0F2LWE1_SPOSC|nr:uncharacterized protein SPSK_05716 [Sporothrix schenckii 1099-18]KJR81149.1 hypothetical protein SPSK_05716 [Sporothrix schenckii 1099-18]
MARGEALIGKQSDSTWVATAEFDKVFLARSEQERCNCIQWSRSRVQTEPSSCEHALLVGCEGGEEANCKGRASQATYAQVGEQRNKIEP